MLSIFFTNQTSLFTDDVKSDNIRTFNAEKRNVFEVVHKWARDYAKRLGCKVPLNIEPF